jgi:murein DD-endopeptidase MepM/ murein hydrolase activator NlpD
MGLKQHTIIFVPHARARFRKWGVTNRQLALFVGGFVFLLIASVFTTWSFFTNTIDRAELERVRAENESLRHVNGTFEDSIRDLEKQLDVFESKTRELAIVAGLESLDSGQTAGIGGPNQPVPEDPLAEMVDGPTGPELEQLAALGERSGAVTGELEMVRDALDERRRLIAATPAIAPARGILTSGFGVRADPVTGRRSMHQGVDISTGPGRPVRATADGVIIKAERMGQLGKAVYISHGYGLVTRYGHLSSIEVEPGQRVSRGDTVGRVGSTGKSTGYPLTCSRARQARGSVRLPRRNTLLDCACLVL